MRIAFLLPGPASRPVGGVRAVYRLASSLVDRGHRVSILHPVAWLGASGPTSPLRRLASWSKHRLLGDFRPVRWLPLDPRVRLRLVPELSARWIRRVDVLIATGRRTMPVVAAQPAGRGVGMALLQHFEDWDGSRQAVIDAWRLPIRKVAISRWLCREAEALGEPCDYIGYGLDHDLFYLQVRPQDRAWPNVALMGHWLEWKGTAVGLRAVEQARKEIPELTAEMFTAEPPAAEPPPWVRVHREPAQEQLRGIYNRAQIFLAPSFSEGWDLPATEAMACGAALIASAIPVREEYAIHGENAWLVPARDPAAMAAAIVRLVRDSELRIRLAENGVRAVRPFTWARCAGRLEQAIQSAARRA